ncbi:MAG: sigma-70 family RNA polymerase sigma factor [Saprospiraceae bacterium]|nr:sigma-70 family RNA polymerase sigma factor [Saprospiraceae bacterium]
MAYQSKKELSDKDLVDMICRSEASRKEAIECIYHWQKVKDQVAGLVVQKGGSLNEALDIYHEGIIILDRNIRQGRYKPEASLQGYLYSICRFLWQNEWRKMQKNYSLENADGGKDEHTPEMQLFDEERKQVLVKVLGLLDESCRKILKLWKLSYTMDEIARNLDLSSAGMAKKYKYRCMKKLMLVLDQQPNLLDALK